ncbi:MAG: biopolymer transporter ExbD [Verrucomicrobia bacterium]|nr:biopolymer transporter ExbD [Verrucomicrobiota bacterium]MBV8377903.1 biopolymer transporter ExbD [Verrucomicrobiota bacterium]
MRFYIKRKRTPQIIIVSLIDIFAMLLIFFIVTTTFKTAQSELSIKLPESKTATQANNPNDPIVLAITSDEKIVLDDHRLKSVDDLPAGVQEAQQKNPNRPLAMKADQKVSFGFLVQVLDALKKAGVKNLPTFTKSPDQK